MNLHLHSLDDNCVLSRLRFESQITWYRFHKQIKIGEEMGMFFQFTDYIEKSFVVFEVIHLPMPCNASVLDAICSTPNF